MLILLSSMLGLMATLLERVREPRDSIAPILTVCRNSMAQGLSFNVARLQYEVSTHLTESEKAQGINSRASPDSQYGTESAG